MEFYSENEKKLSLFGYIFTLFNFIGFAVVLVISPPLFARLTREDSFTEYSGCFFLFSTAVVLLATAVILFRRKPSNSIKYGLLFLSASIVFLWAAGEELSWGQRIIGFEPPAFFKYKNVQNEFNLHNFNTSFFNKSLQNINLLMIIVPSFLLYKNKSSLIGIPLPNILLIFSLQMAMGYSTYLHIDFHDPVSIVCLCLWIAYFYRRKDNKNLWPAVCALAAIALVGGINYSMNEIIATNGPREVREYMFSFICLMYSVNMLLWFSRTPSLPKEAPKDSSLQKRPRRGKNQDRQPKAKK